MKKALFALTLCLSVTALQAGTTTTDETAPSQREIKTFFDDLNKLAMSGTKDDIKLACKKVWTTRRYFISKTSGDYHRVYLSDDVAPRLASFFLIVKNIVEHANWDYKSSFIKDNILPAFNKRKYLLILSLREQRPSQLPLFLEVKEFFKKYQ